MKLSLSWLADHIADDWQMPELSDVVQRLIKHTAEVDDAYVVTIQRDKLFAGQIQEHTDDTRVVFIPELNQSFSLPVRDTPFPDAWYIVYIDTTVARWASVSDLGGGKDAPFPAVMIDDHVAHTGEWRYQIPETDYIIDIDNAAITHRPDLWGHRGFARELALIMQSSLKPDTALYADCDIQDADQAHANVYQPTIATDGCDRFVTYSIKRVTASPSSIAMASRLARVGVRPHNMLVDITNYVMYDIGQPMHAFDADRLPEQHITVRNAHADETITALDDTQVTLRKDDMVVASGDTPLSVAGVIGGKSSGVSSETDSIVLEAAHFDPARIRTTSSHIKRRTESSMRFEKNIDPYATNLAIRRYCALLNQHGIDYSGASSAYAAGTVPEPTAIDISHTFIEKRMGLSVPSDRVCDILQALGCSVSYDNDTYHVTIATYRRTDLVRAEDIVEEVARIIGYDAIPLTLPHRPMYPYDMQPSQRVRTIKNHCAYALSMRELMTYAFYDTQWLQELGWNIDHAVTLSNPVSEYLQYLVTSLIPHQLQAVATNAHEHTQLRFFEWAKIWNMANGAVQEDESLAGIIYAKRDPDDFYTIKSELYSLFQLINMSVSWQPITADETIPQWCDRSACARLLYAANGDWKQLGYVARVDDALLSKVATGTAYAFELSGDALRHYTAADPVFYGMSKYQSTWFDISLYVPESVTVAQIESCVQQADEHIHDVYLVDMYEKAIDGYARSVTVRVTAGHTQKTLTGQEIETIRDKAHQAVKQCGVQVR